MLVIALVIALIRINRSPGLFPVRLLATVWVDVFRGVPTVLLVYLIGFGIPALELEGLPTDPVVLGGDRADALLQRLRLRGLPGRDQLDPPRPDRRGALGRPDRSADDAPRGPAAGDPPRRARRS